MAVRDQAVHKPALTVNDPVPLDNMPSCRLDIVCLGHR